MAAGTVYSREHETDADGDGIDAGEQESGADKLEVAVLLCLLGNYVVAALCYLTNKDTKTEADRSTGLDIFFFFAAVVFTVAPFALAFKYRKEEQASIKSPGLCVDALQATLRMYYEQHGIDSSAVDFDQLSKDYRSAQDQENLHSTVQEKYGQPLIATRTPNALADSLNRS